MIKIDNFEYRNLEEQVQKNKNDITGIIEGERLLAQLGIKVIGQGETTEVLPDPVTYAGEYGDAFLIGTEKPYDFYIFTRPFEGETVAQWFNLGPFPVAGPKGADGLQGPQGEQGIRGSQWFSGTGQPTTISGYNAGDYYINVETGNIWHLHNENNRLVWKLEGNIRGPQGEQGPQGPTGAQGRAGARGPQGEPGPAGPVVNIIGILPSADQLPDPASVERNRNDAFLIETATGHDLYIITGYEQEPMWENAGPFAAGTVVTANGNPQSTFNVDTKVSIEMPAGDGIYVPTIIRKEGYVKWIPTESGLAIWTQTAWNNTHDRPMCRTSTGNITRPDYFNTNLKNVLPERNEAVSYAWANQFASGRFSNVHVYGRVVYADPDERAFPIYKGRMVGNVLDVEDVVDDWEVVEIGVNGTFLMGDQVNEDTVAEKIYYLQEYAVGSYIILHNIIRPVVYSALHYIYDEELGYDDEYVVFTYIENNEFRTILVPLYYYDEEGEFVEGDGFQATMRASIYNGTLQYSYSQPPTIADTITEWLDR